MSASTPEVHDVIDQLLEMLRIRRPLTGSVTLHFDANTFVKHDTHTFGRPPVRQDRACRKPRVDIPDD